MVNFIYFVCILWIIVLCYYLIKKQINSIHDKLNQKYNGTNQNHNEIKSFLIPTYNNSIRLAKKLGVYYDYNKEDYEKHKNEKSL